MAGIPDVNRFRRPPVILPPMSRSIDSTTPSKKISDQPKITKQKSAKKPDESQLDKEREDRARFVHNYFIR